MANPTTNFGWQMPTSTDLVTDLPADFEVFGQAVDTSLVDLKGGTTGQVLSKASNTDMDFTWVAQDDSNAIQNAIVDAKGDLITATAADTPARLAVGTNGQTLVADSSTATGLKWATPASGFKGCAATASYSPTPSTSPFVISFASETFDTDGFHSTAGNTSRLTIPTGLGGYYQINAHLDAVSYNWGYTVAFLYVNGVKAGTTYGVDADQFARNNSSGNTVNVNAILKLAAADYVELFATTDQSLSGTVKAYLQCTYLGA